MSRQGLRARGGPRRGGRCAQEPRGHASPGGRQAESAGRASRTRPRGAAAPAPAPQVPANQVAPPAARSRGPAPGRRAASQWAVEPGRPERAARAEPAQSEKSEPNPSGPPLRTRCRRRRRRLLPPDRVYCPNPKVQFCGPAAASKRDDTGVRQVSEAPARESSRAASGRRCTPGWPHLPRGRERRGRAGVRRRAPGAGRGLAGGEAKRAGREGGSSRRPLSSPPRPLPSAPPPPRLCSTEVPGGDPCLGDSI